jgi:flagellar basal body-associated protein FliL
MIIYTWAQIIFSNWEDEKIKTAKKSILYIIIWIVILIMNYFILTFFFTPELLK